jgi:hypothetical protein
MTAPRYGEKGSQSRPATFWSHTTGRTPRQTSQPGQDSYIIVLIPELEENKCTCMCGSEVSISNQAYMCVHAYPFL